MMKYTLILVSLITAPLAIAGGGHTKPGAHHHDHHDDHFVAGPNGGQVVKSAAGFSFEVAVDKQRKARISMLDEHGKVMPPIKVTITGIAGERANPVKISFSRGEGENSNVLISNKALPVGGHVPMILVIKVSPDAKATTERFELHLD